ncbi:pyridoxal phosphate-dependent aminotransferase [Haliangium sp.]|uniref:pyridoxal phosphate-dependent aminotransferase n=1 Tax=Haliangium sp. TaxID=2663208 RepID=UPI003D0E4D57
MSRYPDLATTAGVLPQSMFARLYERLASFDGDVIPLQIGDTYLPPPAQARLGALGFDTGPDPSLYAYSGPHGDPALLDALVDKLHRINRMDFARADNVQITCGATHALSCAMRAVLDPGDELLVLSPHWPLIRNIALSHAVNPVDVPFSHRLLRLDPGAGAPEDAAVDLISAYVGPQTAAIYLSTPNNPDGMVMSREVLRAVAKVAEKHDLWVLADEVYEHFAYDGHVHTSVATLPGMAGRTVTAFSFSKSYGLAGLRLGYMVGPSPVMAAARRLVNTSVYSVSRAMQRVALRALEHGDGFLREAREHYHEARDRALARVQAPCVAPQGGTYLFLDLGPWIDPSDPCDGASSLGLLERMAEAGLLLAPGFGFGLGYGRWARLCYSAASPARVDEGIDRLNRVLDQARLRVRPHAG